MGKTEIFDDILIIQQHKMFYFLEITSKKALM